MYALDDTIAAIASPPGGAARGIVRVSGPGIRRCLEDCFRPEPFQRLFGLTAASVVPGVVWLPGTAAPLPADLYLWPSRRSYTGQPVAEIHTFGSPPLLELLLRAVCKAGTRPAGPGEFTLRAFLAGRIDLTQAEAVLGVIDATADDELSAALAQLAGGLAGPLHRLRDELLELLAHLEAGFDFADEDLPFLTVESLLSGIDAAADEVARLLARMTARSETASHVRVALVGRPNAGKSSLFNAIAHRPGAIVSDVPGTTRDYLTAELDLDGVKCQLIDTAGVEDVPPSPALPSATAVPGPALDSAVDCRDCRLSLRESSAAFAERKATLPACERFPAADTQIAVAAQDAAHEQHRRALVRVLCIDPTRPLDAWELEMLSADHAHVIVAVTKGDLISSGPTIPDAIVTSAVAGSGIARLRAVVRAAVLHAAGPAGDVVAGTAVRCRESLRLSAESLAHAREMVIAQGGEELVAAEVRVALDEIGKVAGAVYTDDVLDRIFSRFCIGK